jgi:hypothetical protein
MSTKTRDVSTDVPRRIYRSTIDRMDRHLKDVAKRDKSKRKKVKADFNQFLITLLDTYEYLQTVKTKFAIELFDDIEAARGEAIKQSVKMKKKIKPPIEVLIVGEDEAL